jgi:hypothetical protein
MVIPLLERNISERQFRETCEAMRKSRREKPRPSKILLRVQDEKVAVSGEHEALRSLCNIAMHAQMRLSSSACISEPTYPKHDTTQRPQRLIAAQNYLLNSKPTPRLLTCDTGLSELLYASPEQGRSPRTPRNGRMMFSSLCSVCDNVVQTIFVAWDQIVRTSAKHQT